MHLCVVCVCGGGLLDPLGLELEKVVNHNCGCWELNLRPLEE